MNKKWQQLSLSVDKDKALTIADQLTAIGALATSFASSTTQNYVNHEVGDIDFIGEIQVTALFDADFDRRLINLLLDEDLLNNWEILSDDDWQNKWKEGLKPIHFNNRLSVIPSWYEEQESCPIKLKLDAGAAFGTGTHPTTYLCLEWLTNNIHNGETVIDFGCGSGILGIAAGLLGASRVLLTDCDELALSTSSENADLNGVKVETYLPKEFPNIQADVLVANILASVLKELYPTLIKHIKPGGKIALSGILKEQADEINTLYGQSFTLTTIAKDEWVIIFGIKSL